MLDRGSEQAGDREGAREGEYRSKVVELSEGEDAMQVGREDQRANKNL